MLTPMTYGNALMALNGSSNQSSGYMTGVDQLGGSNIGLRRGNAGYANFDLTTQARQAVGTTSIFVGLWGLSRAAFPNNTDWSWRSIPT